MSRSTIRDVASTVLRRLAAAVACSSCQILLTAKADANTRGSMIAATINAMKIRMRIFRL